MTDSLSPRRIFQNVSSSDKEMPLQTSHERQTRRARALRLLTTEVGYIPNKCFHDKQTADVIARQSSARTSNSEQNADDGNLKSLPNHLAQLCKTSLLTAEQERELFQRMNFLKYQANILRSRLDPLHASDCELNEIENLIDQAREIRDLIVKANMRLVIAVVKKFVTKHDSFDEMLSDGIVTLMSTVEKFDYDRGFRFSTYAYRAIARNAYHTVTGNRRKRTRFINNSETIETLTDQDQPSSLREETAPKLQSALLHIIDRLDHREQLIIKNRFGIDTNGKSQTFENLGNRLGVSKERVRQLEFRAIAKLREAVADLHLDDLFESMLT